MVFQTNNMCPAGQFAMRTNSAFQTTWKPSDTTIKKAWTCITKFDKQFSARFQRETKSPDSVVIDAVNAYAPELRNGPNPSHNNNNNNNGKGHNSGKGNNNNNNKGTGKG